MPVDDRRGVVTPESPSLAGNHMITAIEIPSGVDDPRLMAMVKAKDGKRYLIFDPTNERTPVGNLPSYLQGGFGILSAGASSQVIALPVLTPDANGTERKGDFTLSADGTLTGSVDTFHSGSEGAELRMFLKYTDEKQRREYWETRVARDVPGVVLNSFEFVQPSAFDKPLEFHLKLTAAQYAHEKPRTLPIDLNATGRWHDSFDITLPSGYVVDETPDPVSIDRDFASYHSTVTAKGNRLHYEREYVVRQVELPAARAADFRSFESSILADEKGTAVLKKQ
jgi:hypothetical protein